MIGCEEILPTREEPPSLNLSVETMPEDSLAEIGIAKGPPKDSFKFLIGVKNVYYKALDAPKEIRVKIDLIIKSVDSDKRPQEFKRTLIYENINYNESVVIDTNKTYWIRVDWNYKNDDEVYIWDFFPIYEELLNCSTINDIPHLYWFCHKYDKERAWMCGCTPLLVMKVTGRVQVFKDRQSNELPKFEKSIIFSTFR
jgi:hypothetical protein